MEDTYNIFNYCLTREKCTLPKMFTVLKDRRGVLCVMTSPTLPPEHAEKIEELRDHFEKSKSNLNVRAGWDRDTQCVSFPFDDGPSLKHLLRVSKEVLQDFTPSEIIRKLENEKWEEVLSQLPTSWRWRAKSGRRRAGNSFRNYCNGQFPTALSKVSSAPFGSPAKKSNPERCSTSSTVSMYALKSVSFGVPCPRMKADALTLAACTL